MLPLLIALAMLQPTGHVVDSAQMLTPQTRQNLEGVLRQFEAETGHEIAVVTIDTHGADETIESYAVKLFEKWGIGKEKEDNGLLLLIARDDREMRIEVGYGLESAVTDLKSSRVIRDVLTPAFKAGKYDEGVLTAVERIISDIRNGAPVVAERANSTPLGDWSNLVPFFFFFLIYLGSILARSKSWWAGGVVGVVIGIIIGGLLAIIGFAIVGLLFDYIVSKRYHKSKTDGTSPPWWIGGNHIGGRGPGGFGGFGGGMSGGGGASGKW